MFCMYPSYLLSVVHSDAHSGVHSAAHYVVHFGNRAYEIGFENPAAADTVADTLTLSS